jgi:hypothetical protein
MMSREEIETQIYAQASASAQVRQELDKLAAQVRDYWRSVSPIDDGVYAASVKVYKRKFTYKGMPGVGVGATDFKAHWIEYGTGEPGPTPAFAPRAKTAAHFGGDETLVQNILQDDDLSRDELKAALEKFKMPLIADLGGSR